MSWTSMTDWLKSGLILYLFIRVAVEEWRARPQMPIDPKWLRTTLYLITVALMLIG